MKKKHSSPSDGKGLSRSHRSVLPQEHWQFNMNLTPSGTDHGGEAFLPREGKNRPTPHVKTNECDH